MHVKYFVLLISSSLKKKLQDEAGVMDQWMSQFSFYCCDKKHDNKQHGRKGIIWHLYPGSQSTEGSQNRNSKY